MEHLPAHSCEQCSDIVISRFDREDISGQPIVEGDTLLTRWRKTANDSKDSLPNIWDLLKKATVLEFTLDSLRAKMRSPNSNQGECSLHSLIYNELEKLDDKCTRQYELQEGQLQNEPFIVAIDTGRPPLTRLVWWIIRLMEPQWLRPPQPLRPHSHLMGRFPTNHCGSFQYLPVEKNDGSANGWIQYAETIDIASERCQAKYRTWLSDCEAHHAHEFPKPGRMEAARLLRVSLCQRRPKVSLCETRNLPIQTAVRYAALSYCWGGTKSPQTTRSTYESNVQNIDISSLAKTLQDAITVTIALGVEFLWIDSLCIIQDDVADREHEIALMGHIYRQATITIAVSRVDNADAGFLHALRPYGSFAPEKVLKMSLRRAQGDVSSVILAPMHPQWSENYGDPQEPSNRADYLRRRAWAFQERFFSHRILDFQSDCVHWLCPASVSCDRGEDLCARFVSLDTRFVAAYTRVGSEEVKNWHENWWDIVNNISGLNLSNVGDRLPAIAGIAKIFQAKNGDQYCAGLWQSHLPQDLLWHYGQKTWKEIDVKKSERPAAPSWSWAKDMKPALNFHLQKEDRLSLMDTISVDLDLSADQTPYGSVLNAQLVAKCPVLPIDKILGVGPYEDTTRIQCSTLSDLDDSVKTDIYEDRSGEMEEAVSLGHAYVFPVTIRDKIVWVENYIVVDGLAFKLHANGKFSRLGLCKAEFSGNVPGTLEKVKKDLLSLPRRQICII